MKTHPFSLHGRRALITGGSRGIGAAIARSFADAGAEVGICHHKDEANAMALAAEFEVEGKRLHLHPCDVSDASQVEDLAHWADAALGGIDILVNCAGIGGDVAFNEMDTETWDRMIAVNLRSVFLVSHRLYPAMAERGYGRIINIASQLAYKGAPGLVHYCAAKAGVVGFTRALAHEAAPHGVLVNAIAPGPVETPLLNGLSSDWRAMKKAQLPLGRFGHVDEIAPSALLLACETSGAFYCGQTLSPNGGDVMI